VPVSATFCGLPVALSANEIFAVRLPVVEGVKVMLTEQVAPGASVPLQVFAEIA
jgi:hypothetical protein